MAFCLLERLALDEADRVVGHDRLSGRKERPRCPNDGLVVQGLYPGEVAEVRALRPDSRDDVRSIGVRHQARR